MERNSVLFICFIVLKRAHTHTRSVEESVYYRADEWNRENIYWEEVIFTKRLLF